MESERTEEKVQKIIERFGLGNASSEKEVGVSENKSESCVHVFEFGEEGKPVEITAKVERESVEQTSPDEVGAPSPVRELKNNQNKEFKIPDVFDIAEKETTRTINTPSSIFPTYVPRFTEASENYRMINDPRPRKQFSEEKKEVVSESVVLDDNSASDSYVSMNEDPTAELDEVSADAVVVNMSAPTKDEEADSLNVFKFSEEDSSEVHDEKERTVDDERADIDRLIFGSEDKNEEQPLESNPCEFEQEEHIESEIPKNYTIPDPDSGLRVVDYEKEEKKPGPSPDGVSEYVPDKGKKRIHEFELPIQRDSIKDRFLDSLIGIKVRIGAVIFFAMLLLGFEVSVFFDWINDSNLALFTFAGATAVIDFMLASCAFVMVIPEVLRSVKSIAKGKLISEFMLVAGYLTLAVYVTAVTVVGVFTFYPLYGFLFSTFALSSVLATYAKVKADFSAFKLISGNGEKDILEKRITRELPEENYALDGLVDEYKSRTARVFRAAFVTDFFKRSSKETEKNSHNAIIISVSFTISLIVAVVTHFINNAPISGFSAFSLVFLLSLPAFTLLSYKLTYKDAEESAIAEDGAIVGVSSLNEFSEVDVICFEDSDIFGIDDVNLKRFMLYGDRDNMENVMRQMCSLFSVIKGPLYSIFSNALDNRVRHNPAKGVVIESDGISGEVSGKKICAGNEEYMLRHRIAIPEGAAVPERGSDTTKVMYAAENGEIYAKFYIRYSFSEEFTMLLPALKSEGIIPLVYTSDPNISNELLKRLTAGSDCIRAMKRLAPGTTDENLHNRVSSGIVSVGEKINNISLLLLAKKHSKLITKINVTALFAMGLGAAVGAAIALVDLSAFPFAFLGIWQIFWCLVLRFASKNVFLKGEKNNEDSDDEK